MLLFRLVTQKGPKRHADTTHSPALSTGFAVCHHSSPDPAHEQDGTCQPPFLLLEKSAKASQSTSPALPLHDRYV